MQSLIYTYSYMLMYSRVLLLQAVSRAVFKGLQDLLKYLLQCVEEELQRDSEATIFSVFLILRLAFSIHLPPPPSKQKAGGGGGGSGLSFFSALFGTDEDRSKPRRGETVEMENVIGRSVEECDGGEGRGDVERKEKEEGVKENGGLGLTAVASSEEETTFKDVLRVDSEDKPAVPSSLLDDEEEEGDTSPKLTPEIVGPRINLTQDGAPVRTIGSASSAFTPLVDVEGRLPSAHPVATPPSTVATPPSTVATPPSGQLHLCSPNLPNGDDLPDQTTARETE